MVSAIETRGLVKRFGSLVAVDRLSLRVERGETYGFLGLNGAGKTTTVRMLAGTLPPTEGTATVLGVEVADGPEDVRRRVGVVFGDNIVAEPRWSVVRYLRWFGALYGLPRGEADARARHVIERLRLGDFAEKPTGTLSGGNRRKVEIARALLHGPQLLFLDEPTRELDIPSKYATWEFLRDLRKDGVTLFISSHDVHEIEQLCTRIGVIRAGRLVWGGKPSDLPREGGSLVGTLSRTLEGTWTPPMATLSNRG